jgi:hypothetical protein
MSYYNKDIPLESALEMFDDPDIRHEIIEDYYLHHILGDLALKPGEPDDEGHIILGYD